jgi:hypothetical protein
MRLQVTATTLRALLPTVLCLTVSACGNSGDSGGGAGGGGSTSSSSLGTCGIRADVAGGTAIQFTGKDDAACATEHSFDTGLDGSFIGTDAKGTLELIVDDVAEGKTGSDFPTRIVVTSPAKERWQGTGCLTSISEHHLVKTEASEIGELRHYQVSGEGTCAKPLDSVPTGGDAVTLGPFTFRAQFTWRD